MAPKASIIVVRNMSVSRHAKKGDWRTGSVSRAIERREVPRNRKQLSRALEQYCAGRIISTATERQGDISLVTYEIGYHKNGGYSELNHELRRLGYVSYDVVHSMACRRQHLNGIFNAVADIDRYQ